MTTTAQLTGYAAVEACAQADRLYLAGEITLRNELLETVAPEFRNGREVLPQCYGCGTVVADEPGRYYCDECVAKQTAEYYGGSELAAFDAYHAWADTVSGGAK